MDRWLQNAITAYQLNIELIIAIISLLAAVGAAVFAYRSNIISAKALRIAQRQQDSHDSQIVPYLIESIAQKDDEAETVAFAVSYTNSADMPNSIARVDLELHYVGPGGVVNYLLFPLADRVRVGLELDKLPLLRAPISLGARSTVSGWLVFEIPRAVKNGPTEKYRIRALAASGDCVVTDCFLVRSLIHEKGDASG